MIAVGSDNSTYWLIGGQGVGNEANLWLFQTKTSTYTKFNTTFSYFGTPTYAQNPQGDKDVWIYGNDTQMLVSYSIIYQNFTHYQNVDHSIPSEGAASAVVNNNFYVFGGIGNDSACSNSLSYFNGSQWFKVDANSTLPEKRAGATLVVHHESLLLVGGYCGAQYYSDIWSYSLKTNKWSLVNATTFPRAFHSSVVSDDVLYVFGGKNGEQVFDELNALDLTKTTWKPLKANGTVAAREQTAMIVSGSRIILYGGRNDQTFYDDVYSFILELQCSSLNCANCVRSPKCGWCASSGVSFCAAGDNSASYIPQCQADYAKTILKCPEEFPSWMIAMIVIAGVVLVGIIVFIIMKVKNGKEGYVAVS